MAFESMVALALAVALLAGIAWYDSIHRAKDKKDRRPGKLAQ